MNANKNYSPSEKLDYVIKRIEELENKQYLSFVFITTIFILSAILLAIGIAFVVNFELAK